MKRFLFKPILMMKNIISIYFIILFGLLVTSGCKKENSIVISKKLKYITFKSVSKYGTYWDTSQFFYYEGNYISKIKYKFPIKYDLIYENGKLIRTEYSDSSYKKYVQNGNVVTGVKYPENKRTDRYYLNEEGRVMAYTSLDAYGEDSSYTEYTYINGNLIKSQKIYPVEIEPFIYEYDDKINSFYDANIYWNHYSYSRNNRIKRNGNIIKKYLYDNDDYVTTVFFYDLLEGELTYYYYYE